jgi:hypothetical protein
MYSLLLDLITRSAAIDNPSSCSRSRWLSSQHAQSVVRMRRPFQSCFRCCYRPELCPKHALSKGCDLVPSLSLTQQYVSTVVSMPHATGIILGGFRVTVFGTVFVGSSVLASVLAPQTGFSRMCRLLSRAACAITNRGREPIRSQCLLGMVGIPEGAFCMRIPLTAVRNAT